MKRSLLSIIIPAALLAACSPKADTPQPESMTIERLDKMVFEAAGDSTAIRRIAGEEKSGRHLAQFAAVTGASSLPTVEFASLLASSQAVEMFTPDVMERLPDMDAAEKDLAAARARWREMFPALPFPAEAVAVVSPFRQSVFFVDSTLFIASNHFLGSDYAGYEGFNSGERIKKSPSRIVPTVVEALLRSNFKMSESSPTLIADMVYEGLVAHTLAALAPLTEMSEILGIAPDDLHKLEKSESDIWRAIVGEKLLFSRDPSAVRRIVDSPVATNVGGVPLPPGAGRYIGLKIIESLAAAEGDDPARIAKMFESQIWDSPDILKNSHYNPH